MRLPIALTLAACSGAPSPLPAPTGPALQAPAWLVEHVAPDGVHTPPLSAPGALLDDPMADVSGWSRDDAATHDPGIGHAAAGALRLGAPDTTGPRVDVSHTISVPSRTRCTVRAWARTEGLEGERLQGGAALEVRQVSEKKDPKTKKPTVFLHDHLPRLRGTTGWTEQALTLDTDETPTTLEIVLSGGRGTGGGQAWFDDISVDCLDPVAAYLRGGPVWKGQGGAPVGRVRIARTERPSVLAPAGSAWAVTVSRDEPQVLRTLVGLDATSTGGAEACFAITVDGHEATHRCIDDRDGWRRMQVDLPAAPGTTSTLGFTVAASSEGEGALLLGAWGDPSLDAVTQTPDPRPDLLLVIFDTLRADDLGVGGNDARPASPGLDALAAQGTWYSQARSPTSWTLPSIATMLTGVSPPTHGAGWRIRREVRHKGSSGGARRQLDYAAVRPDAPRLAGRLRDAGYRTTMLGSNHYLDSKFGFATAFSAYGDYAGSSVPGVTRAFPRLKDAIDEEAEPGGRPHLMVLHLLEPHLPYRFRTPTPDGFEMPDVFETEHQEVGDLVSETLRRVGAKEEAHPQELIVMHQADFRYGDDQVATITADMPDDAIIIVASDHGEAFGEHGTFLHGHHLYDETVHVPMIVRWPGGAHAGTTVDQPVGLAQLAPTLLEAAGLPLDGLEGAPLPRPGSEGPAQPLFFEHIYKGPDQVGVLDGGYKRVRQLPLLGLDSRVKGRPGAATLYNLLGDPEERVDLSSVLLDVAARLDAQIDARIDATLPGTHLRCVGPHDAVTVRSGAPFVRGVPLDASGVDTAPDRRTLTLPARGAGETRIVVEAADGAPISVSPPDACSRWEIDLPRAGVQLDDEQLDQLEAIGYVED
jgi:arylsulfatase A-like enzyme